jgi:tetratricopeptide (TPR) repeat protein
VLCACSLALGAAPVRAETARRLVVPFENPRDEPRIYWLSEASAVLLADDLNALGADALTRNQRVRAFEQLHLPATATLSRATVIKVGQLVGATHVILGSLELEDDALTVRARTIRVDAGRFETEVVERGPLADLFAVFERVARRVAEREPADAPLERSYPPLEAFESYVKGLLAETPVSRARFLEGALTRHSAYDRARLALWEVRAEEGDHDAALAAVAPVAADSPFARRARFLAALSRLELKQFEEASAALEALAAERRAGAVDNNLGIVRLRHGAAPDKGRPTYYFDRAVKADPNDPDFLFNLGYAYSLERDLPAAMYWLREAVRRNPADADAHYVLGLALQATGRAAEGTRERELALQLTSKFEEWEERADKAPFPPGLERVRTEIEAPLARELDAALVDSAQREQRDLALFHLDRARRFDEQEQDREAIAEVRRTIYLAPYHAEAHLLLGRLYLRAGRTREAIDELKISIWSEASAAAHVALGEAYLKAEDPEAARGEAQKALVLEPGSAAAKRLLDQIGRQP